jgi:hypothetical protein
MEGDNKKKENKSVHSFAPGRKRFLRAIFYISNLEKATTHFTLRQTKE